jgi:secreted trypsin-like serine protease
MMKRLLVLSAFVPALVPGCVIDAPDVSTHEGTIIGGTRSIGVEATVMLAGFPPDRSVLHACTAVVVSPTILLTSAHCVDAPNHPNYLYGVFTGDDASPYANLAQLEPELESVTSVHPHPQYDPNLPFYADIAVVRMAAPLPITPAQMQRTAIDNSIIGKNARIVGYGQTVYGTYNQTRHEAMTTVAMIENDTIVVGDSTKRSCLGDSGGPAFVDGKVVGIDSYGPVGCGAAAHYRRVDSFLPFIEQYVPAPIEPDPTDPDPDVDPMGDEDGGGCSTTRSNGLAWVLVLGALLISRRRTRR